MPETYEHLEKRCNRYGIENERIIHLLWKTRREHIENRMSSYGKVLNYIDEAIGKDVIAEKVKKALKDI